MRALLNRWLAAFAVTPREALPEAVARVAADLGARARSRQRFGGYAVHALIARPDPEREDTHPH